MLFPFRHAVATACAFAVSAALGAETRELTLGAALDRARIVNPQLAAFVSELHAQEARGREAALRPMPSAELLIEDFAGSGARSGFDSAQTTLSLSQVFELGGQRDQRIGASQARLAHLRSEQSVRQLDLVAGITRTFISVVADQERVRAAQEALSLAIQVRTAVMQRVKAAASPEAEGSRAEVAVLEADLALEDARHRLETARFELGAMIGLSEPDFLQVAAELFELPRSPDLRALLARLESSPDLERLGAEAKMRDAELKLAQSRQAGEVRGTLGARRLEDGDDDALIAAVSVPLFAVRQGAPAVDAAQAASEQVPPQRQAALLDLRARLFARYQEMEHARHVASTLKDRVLPQLDKTLEQTEYAYRRGRYSFLEWSEAQRRQLEARARLIDAATEFHINRIEIERLTGESLGAGAAS